MPKYSMRTLLKWPRCFYRGGLMVIVNFYQDGCLMKAASLAYTSLLSIVPLLAVSLVVLQAFPAFSAFSQRIEQFIFSHFVATSAQVIQIHIQRFTEQATKLSAPGMVFLLITAVLMIVSMEQAFNAIWRVKKSRRGLAAFLMYWAVLTLLPVLVSLGFMASSYLTTFRIVEGARQWLSVNHLVLRLTPYFVSWFTFTLLYQGLPNCKVKFYYALCAGAVTAFLFECAKWGFAFYITHFPTYQLLYGALASIPIFLIWLYVCWLVILFGVEVSYFLSKNCATS